MPNTKTPITVVILSYNEAINIKQALTNVVGWAQDVFVLDSHSTDNTTDIALSMGATLFYRSFDNYAKQRNYAIKELPIVTEWMLFLDADEYLTEELKSEISRLFENKESIKFDGYYLKRRFYFMDKWIRHGGYYPTIILRLFKKNNAICEREINEHIQIEGEVGYLRNDFVDYNRKNFAEWLNKHNKYSNMEAQQLLVSSDLKAPILGSSLERKHWMRENLWVNMPPLLRPFFLFFYVYIIRLGFLDGRAGFIYHFMHALCYRFIIDIKYLEMKKSRKNISRHQNIENVTK